jgi:hypothetical protein
MAIRPPEVFFAQMVGDPVWRAHRFADEPASINKKSLKRGTTYIV